MKTKTLSLLFLLAFSISGLKAQPIKFNTDFEAGSIGSYELIDSVWFKRSNNDSTLMLSYDIHSKSDPDNPTDVTLPPSGRWFYFQMTGVKDKQLFITFHNTDPLCCMYSYDNKIFERLEPYEAPARRRIMPQFEKDTVYLAYYTPYTFSYLQKRLNDWTTASPKTATLETIGQSTQGRPMQLLTITDPNTDNSGKKRIWIQGRIHTSESPASWHLDGFIDALLTNNPEAEAIRKSTIFYINLYVNPDGVYHGLSRSNTNGVNLEINWGRPVDSTEQEVKVLKAKMSELTKDKPFDMYLGMHSQVANKATYWVHKAASTTDRYFQTEMLLTYLTCASSPDYLKKADLDFSDVAPRYPEGWLWNQWGEKTLAITFETPYTFYCDNPRGPWVMNENLRDFGKKTLTAVADYFGISSPNRIIIDNDNAKLSGSWNTHNSASVVYHGYDCVLPRKAGSKITYRTDNVTAGNYKIYIWHPGAMNNNEQTNTWLYLQDYRQKKNGKFSLRLTVDNLNDSNGNAMLYDAILLVRNE